MPNESFEELLKRDAQREKDGFKKKIRIRRILSGSDKVIAIPFVVEEKLIHGNFEPTGEHGLDEAGHGEGEVGDIIGEIPLSESGEDGDGDEKIENEEPKAGEGEGEHGIETEAYQLGKELSEELKLPDLRDKGKKVPTDEYVYDLTDRHKGSGQFLDKKATLISVVKSNIALGRIDKHNIDTTKLVVGPQDKIYRILSKERVWKSQAVVFFLRDYSGSMEGDPTKAILSQHLMIYSWLLFQFKRLVIPRFFVHDFEAEEVSVEAYFTKTTNGGTFIPSVYQEVNRVVEKNNLARDYNIYVFQGTDGDDGDDGEEAIPEIEKILSYVNRMGVSVLKSFRHLELKQETQFEQYIKAGNFTDRKDVFRMHLMSDNNVTDENNKQAVRALVAED